MHQTCRTKNFISLIPEKKSADITIFYLIDVTYFVTFRLADSISQSVLKQWKYERALWLISNPKPWSPETEAEFHRRFSLRIENWLDQGYGSCLLKDPGLRELVESALGFFEGTRYLRHASVIMPNHVYVLFTPICGHQLGALLHSWKSFTAKLMNSKTGATGELWQRTYFDRIIRSQEHFGRCVRYIRANPGKAGLGFQESTVFESAWVGGLDI